MNSRWTPEEEALISRTSNLLTGEAFKVYCEHFPGKRTYRSFATKRSKDGACQATLKRLKWKSEYLAFIDGTKGQKREEAYEQFCAKFPDADITPTAFYNQRSRSGVSDKKPHGPNKRCELFAERLKCGYVVIKIAESNVWVSKARWVYQNAHPEDKLEPKDNIFFLDRNNRNFDPENLLKVRSRERTLFLAEGGVADDPEETRLNLARARLKLAQLDLGEKLGIVKDYGAGRKFIK